MILRNEEISRKLEKQFLIPADYFEIIDSTNAEAKRQIAAGLRGDKLFLAGAQTAGRGRLGRTFVSQEKQGIYFSYALHVNTLNESLVRLTAKTAVGVLRGIQKVCPVQLSIKWVNDLLLDHKKLCGILAETLPDAFHTGSYAVIGVGINTGKDAFPEELKDIATSLRLNEEQTKAVFSSVFQELLKEWKDLENLDYLQDYRTYSCVLGKNITFGNLEKMEQGLALDIDDTGALLVKKTSGEVVRLNTGEISVRL